MSESELRDIVLYRNPVFYDIKLRSQAKVFTAESVTNTITFTVPVNTLYVVWSASIDNSGDVAEPVVLMKLPNSSDSYIWPALPSSLLPSTTGATVSLVDDSLFPQVIPTGTVFTIIDYAWSAGETISLHMLYTELNMDLIS